ncbi:MAG: hypothetical protein LIO46_07525 [Clostridiales bacterium]|nr:hypothetical protein [Clostridiales bacterium]
MEQRPVGLFPFAKQVLGQQDKRLQQKYGQAVPVKAEQEQKSAYQEQDESKQELSRQHPEGALHLKQQALHLQPDGGRILPKGRVPVLLRCFVFLFHPITPSR